MIPRQDNRRGALNGPAAVFLLFYRGDAAMDTVSLESYLEGYMAKTGGAVQKLIEKRKRQMVARVFGTCKPMSPRGFNAGKQFGLVDQPVDTTRENGKVITGDAERSAVYARFTKRSFNKWQRYGV